MFKYTLRNISLMVSQLVLYYLHIKICREKKIHQLPQNTNMKQMTPTNHDKINISKHRVEGMCYVIDIK